MTDAEYGSGTSGPITDLTKENCDNGFDNKTRTQ
eukprot:CAMPEP_0202443000 /NCGR_PEP_ID=MMETSP1360-20130828/2357_1 /ASSEMBLY_ACC=CAM_ASM_000848 /TAXON_ID=515479 /ORGANISM="Licmophora paradoxa, Strain CCMP2313" /LENGTH=33 /DNA_ID= /DNA_START= /DNA_END= /DNA_ORIENTATION=